MSIFGWSYPPGCSGPPEPDPVLLHCMLCGTRCRDEDLDVDDLPEDNDYTVCPCPNKSCLQAGGLHLDEEQPYLDFWPEEDEEDEYWSSNFAKHGIYLDDE